LSGLLEGLGVGQAGLADFWEIVAKILLSALLGGAVGAERERTGKWAGLRTHMSIAVGSALLTDVSIGLGTAYGPPQGWDPGRIAAQIVSGLGFIGAGTIIQSRGEVRGLTTAAGLWVAGAIGLATGAGYWIEAVVTTVALVVILAALRPVARRLSGGKAQSVALHLAERGRLPELMAILDQEGIDAEHMDLSEGAGTDGSRPVTIHFQGRDEERRRLAGRLREESWVKLEGD
jgi:putative Mg2+ transporter-C (MgtC) family protein